MARRKGFALADGPATFVGFPNNADLFDAFHALARLQPVRCYHPHHEQMLQRACERVDDLNRTPIAQRSYRIPRLSFVDPRDEATRNAIANDFTLAMGALRVFILEDLKGAMLINQTLSVLNKEDAGPHKEVLMRYWTQSASAAHHQLVFYRRGKISAFACRWRNVRSKDNAVPAGVLVFIAPYWKVDDVETGDLPEADTKIITSFLDQETANFHQGDGYAICRVIGERFIYDWLNEFAWHAKGKRERFFQEFFDQWTFKTLVQHMLLGACLDRIVVLQNLVGLYRTFRAKSLVAAT